MPIGPNAPYTDLDQPQIIQRSFEETNDALRTIAAGGTLVPENYDQIDLAYITSGNGTGEIGTVTYKLDGSTIATLTLTYDSSNRLISTVKS